MKNNMKKRLDALEDQAMEKLYVVIYKDLPPYYAIIQLLDTKEMEDTIELPGDGELDCFLEGLPRNAEVVMIECGGVQSYDLMMFGQ